MVQYLCCQAFSCVLVNEPVSVHCGPCDMCSEVHHEMTVHMEATIEVVQAQLRRKRVHTDPFILSQYYFGLVILRHYPSSQKFSTQEAISPCIAPSWMTCVCHMLKHD